MALQTSKPPEESAASVHGQGVVEVESAATNASESQAELAAIQADLKNSQILPSNFKTVPDFDLLDGDGNALTAAILEGRWNLLFFGFTHCPDVCPITLSVMNNVVVELQSRQADPMQVVFVTVSTLPISMTTLWVSLVNKMPYTNSHRRWVSLHRSRPTMKTQITTQSITRHRCYLSIHKGEFVPSSMRHTKWKRLWPTI